MLAFNDTGGQITINVPNAPGQAPTPYVCPARAVTEIPDGLCHRRWANGGARPGTLIEELSAGRIRPLDHELDGIRQLARRAGLLRDTDDWDEGKDAALAAAPHYQRITAPRVVVRQGVHFQPGNTPFDIRANGDSLLVGVHDLQDITLSIVQVTDGGEADLALELSPDGVAWAPFATYTEASFAAGDGAAVGATHSLAANGRSLATAYFRLRCTGMDIAGGVYGLMVAGLQRVA
jgi:hypothetical protein